MLAKPTSRFSNDGDNVLIIYESFKNGDMEIFNVPYKLETGNKKNKLVLTSSVMVQLSEIIGYMEEHYLTSADYLNFKGKIDMKHLSLSKECLEDEESVIAYVKQNWLENYLVILNSLGLIPHTNKTPAEIHVIRKKIEHLHEGLNMLPEIERQIIVLKYMTKEKAYDPEIIENLSLSRTDFYRKQRKGLYTLGKYLLGMD